MIHILQNLAEKRGSFFSTIVFGLRQGEAKREQILRLVAEIDMQSQEALGHQRRADKHDESQSHLRSNQYLSHSSSSLRACRAILQGAQRPGARCFEGRNQAK